MRVQLPELERRRRQLEVIEKKARTAEARKDQAGMNSAHMAYASTAARIAELEAADSTEPTRRRRGEKE